MNTDGHGLLKELRIDFVCQSGVPAVLVEVVEVDEVELVPKSWLGTPQIA